MLEPIKYLLLDVRYEKVRREDNTVVDCALLIAYGITESGRRCVLGVSVELPEAEVHWRKFLELLVARGLHGLKLIVSDNHVGLKAARMSVFPSVPWQRCQFHLQQNATSFFRKSNRLFSFFLAFVVFPQLAACLLDPHGEIVRRFFFLKIIKSTKVVVF